ncbi:hypothetical protein JZ751_023825, partial [Albula glossodonta]
MDIFKSCVHSEQMLSLTPTKPIKVSDIYLSKEQINSQTPGNLLHVFFTNVRPPKKVLEDQLTQILRKYGAPKPNKSKYSKAGKEQHQGKVVSTKRPITKPPTKEKTALSEKKPILKPKSPEKARPDEKDTEKSPAKKQEVPEEKYLTLEGFYKFTVDRAKQDIRSVWRAILACGYDLHFERCTCIDTRHAQKACRKWSLEMDVALVQYINRLCRHLAITPARLHPHEAYLDPADAADPRVACLLGVPVESLRLRFALLQSLNNTLETFFLPLVELRQTHTYQNSIAALLCEAKGLIFYDTKVTVMNRVLNATIRSSENTYFCQAARQLSCVPSSQLCVDPSGTFCGRCLLGIAIRADVPLPLDLLGSFWKGLVGEPLDPDADLQEADLLTYNYVKKFDSVSDEAELEALCAEISSQHHTGESPDSPSRPCCTFTYVTMTGEEVELCQGGRSLSVSPLEVELRTCGLPYINLEFLKAHTMYQVGLMETDQHIEFFWTALEMFTQEELCKFIKFACNQERIPFTCPCKDGGPDTAHVPPYPMKIAPPDGAAGDAGETALRHPLQRGPAEWLRGPAPPYSLPPHRTSSCPVERHVVSTPGGVQDCKFSYSYDFYLLFIFLGFAFGGRTALSLDMGFLHLRKTRPSVKPTLGPAPSLCLSPSFSLSFSLSLSLHADGTAHRRACMSFSFQMEEEPHPDRGQRAVGGWGGGSLVFGAREGEATPPSAHATAWVFVDSARFSFFYYFFRVVLFFVELPGDDSCDSKPLLTKLLSLAKEESRPEGHIDTQTDRSSPTLRVAATEQIPLQ